MALWRFHGQRFFSANYFSRGVIGLGAAIYVADFAAAYQYGIPRMRDPNVLWPYWLAFQAKIRAGLIPENTPGYAVVAWRNAREQRDFETLNVEEINNERNRRLHHAGFAPSTPHHHENGGHH
jgi:hypothetical protein